MQEKKGAIHYSFFIACSPSLRKGNRGFCIAMLLICVCILHNKHWTNRPILKNLVWILYYSKWPQFHTLNFNLWWHRKHIDLWSGSNTLSLGSEILYGNMCLKNVHILLERCVCVCVCVCVWSMKRYVQNTFCINLVIICEIKIQGQ